MILSMHVIIRLPLASTNLLRSVRAPQNAMRSAWRPLSAKLLLLAARVCFSAASFDSGSPSSRRSSHLWYWSNVSPSFSASS